MCRDTTLRDIRQEALIVEVEWEARTLFLVVAKTGDRFLNLQGKDGERAQSLSEAALHLYEKEGKEWSQRARMKRGARQRERAKEKLQRAEDAQRDEPWPIAPPDMPGLALLHTHNLPGDRWAKEPAGGMVALEVPEG